MSAPAGLSLQRFFYLFVGASFLLLWIQVLLLHWRGAFRLWPMWGPVLFAPVLSAMGILFAVFYGPWLAGPFIAVFSLGVLDGLAGIYYHFAGVRHYVGGWTLRNFIAGPPVVLPVLFTALSAAALMVYLIWP